MRPGNREHVSHVAMHAPHTPLHLGRPSRVQRYSSIMHRAMEEDSLMIRHDDGMINSASIIFYRNIKWAEIKMSLLILIKNIQKEDENCNNNKIYQ